MQQPLHRIVREARLVRVELSQSDIDLVRDLVDMRLATMSTVDREDHRTQARLVRLRARIGGGGA